MGGKPSSVRVVGPLAQYMSGFREELERQGYKPNSVADQLRLMAHASRWLAGRKLDVGDLDASRVQGFLKARRAEGYVLWLSPKAMEPMIGFLRGIDAAPLPTMTPPTTPAGVLLGEYRGYLVSERGLAPGTITSYMHTAGLFLRWWAGDGGLRLDHLDAKTVIDFVLAETKGRRVGSAKDVVCGTRALLRYLFAAGQIEVQLAVAVPKVAAWALSGLPAYVGHKEVDRLLASCDRRSTFGQRDFAVLVLLARMGLRAGEVTALELGDIDWRAGEILVRGKGHRDERLPLVVEAGEALVGWLHRGRPHCDCPQVFTRVRAPHRRLTTSAVSAIVAAACVRAGLPVVHAHRLRHSAATEMLRAGANLTEVGQVLRHRSLLTTAIYAKVDRVALGALAQPWPGSAS